MFEGLEDSQIESAIEALLFVTDHPVDAITLAEMLEVDVLDATAALDRMRQARAESQSGIQLLEVAGGWRLYTHPAFDELLEKYVLSWGTRKLSQAALEVLAIVAYGQPLTRAQVSDVRGVNSDSVINTLVERGLVRKAGEAETPGNPTLYATTKAFLEKFGLSSCDELPNLEDYAPDENVAKLIRERLGAVRADDNLTQEEVAREVRRVEDEEPASPFGVVEKIDFDSLSFDMDSE